MCCGQTEHHGQDFRRGSCGCPGVFACQPIFLSQKRRIKMVEQLLEDRREEVRDLETLLDELRQEQEHTH